MACRLGLEKTLKSHKGCHPFCEILWLTLQRWLFYHKILIICTYFSRFSEKITIFAKNTAHNERHFKIKAYLCIRDGENPSQTWHRKRLAFSRPMNLDTHLKEMEKLWRTSLGYESIGVPYLHTRVWAVSNLFFQAVQGLSVGLAIGSHLYVSR